MSRYRATAQTHSGVMNGGCTLDWEVLGWSEDEETTVFKASGLVEDKTWVTRHSNAYLVVARCPPFSPVAPTTSGGSTMAALLPYSLQIP